MYTTKNSLPDNTRKAMISLLQDRLYDSVDVMTQTKQAHWNVKGPSFIGLHELFDKVHADMDDYTDNLAERIVILGGQAEGTARAAANNSSIEEYPLDITDQDKHVVALSLRLASFGDKIRKSINEASESGDEGTADLFTEISRGVDKNVWFIEAHAA